MTIDEYLALEGEEKLEFANGEVWAMAGGSARHNAFCYELAAELRGFLPAGCRGATSDQRILVAETGLYTYPDLAIVCGPWELSSGQALENPSVLVEVLSPSTEGYDRGAKSAHYRRNVEGIWELHESSGQDPVLPLVSLGATVHLGPLYDRVEELPLE